MLIVIEERMLLLINTNYDLPVRNSGVQLYKDEQRPSYLSLMIGLEGVMVLNANLWKISKVH